MFEKLKNRSLNRSGPTGRKVKPHSNYKEKQLLDDYNMGILIPEVQEMR